MSKFFIPLSTVVLTTTTSVSSTTSFPEQVCSYAILGENRVPLSTCIPLSPQMILGGFIERQSGSLMLECDGDDDDSIRVLQFADGNCNMFEDMHHLYTSTEAPIIGCRAGDGECAIRVRRERDLENCEVSDNFDNAANDSNDATLDGQDQVFDQADDVEEMVFLSSVCHTSSLSEISYTLQCSADGDRLLARFWNSAACGRQMGDVDEDAEQGSEGRAGGDQSILSRSDFFGDVYDVSPDEMHELMNGECSFGHRYFIECPNLNASGLYIADAAVDEDDSGATRVGVISVRYLMVIVVYMMFVACVLA